MRACNAGVHLPQQRANNVGGSAAGADLPWRRVEVALAGIPERAARGKVERVCDTVGTSMPIFQHVRRDDESPPGEQTLGRWKSLGGEPEGDGAARLREQAREGLRGQALMRPGDREKDGIDRHGINAVKGAPYESRKASRLGAFDDGEQGARCVVLSGEDESVHARASRVEEIASALGRHVDVGYEGQSRQALLDLSKAFEVRCPVPIEIKDGNPHRLAVADADEGGPVRALLQLVAIA